MKNGLYTQLENLKSTKEEYRELIDTLESDHFHNLSIISHEMMNKLAFIASSHQLITMKHPEACDFPFWSEMESSISDFMKYLERLSLCRYVHAPNHTNVDLDDILYSLHDFMDDEFPNNNNELIYNAKESYTLFADYEHLFLIFKELIKNACEAIEHNLSTGESNEQTITINTYKDTLYNKTPAVSIEVINPGTAPDIEKAANCEMFYTTKENHSGTGLYIINTVCHKHNGTLSIKNECDRTVVTVTLPL